MDWKTQFIAPLSLRGAVQIGADHFQERFIQICAVRGLLLLQVKPTYSMPVEGVERHQALHVLRRVGDGGGAAQELRGAAVVETHPHQPTEHRRHVRPERTSDEINTHTNSVRRKGHRKSTCKNAYLYMWASSTTTNFMFS